MKVHSSFILCYYRMDEMLTKILLEEKMNILNSIRNLSKFEKRLWMISDFLVILSFLLLKNHNWLTLAASFVGITALIFIAKGDVLGQILTLVFSVMYAIISYQFRYYGEMITYMGMTAPIAFLSVITWLKNPYAENEVKVNKLKRKTWIILVLLTGAVTWSFYFILKTFDTPNLFFGTVSIATSFLASSLMMLRSPYYALAYAMNDIILIILWVLASIDSITYFPMILCFSIFLLNDIYGFRSWRIMREKQQSVSLVE